MEHKKVASRSVASAYLLQAGLLVNCQRLGRILPSAAIGEAQVEHDIRNAGKSSADKHTCRYIGTRPKSRYYRG